MEAGVLPPAEPFTSTWPSFNHFKNEVVQMNTVLCRSKVPVCLCIVAGVFVFFLLWAGGGGMITNKPPGWPPWGVGPPQKPLDCGGDRPAPHPHSTQPLC